LGEAEVPVVKSLLNVQLDIEHFSRAQKIILQKDFSSSLRQTENMDAI
jgi:hypothetical protein